MKKLLSIVLSVIILVVSLPVSTFASDGLVNQNLQASKNTENNTAFETQTVDVTLPNLSATATTSTVTSGTTGDCTWTLDGSVLTISGNGEMGNYYYPTGPWGTSITSVIIEDGVTSIGSSAFRGCTSLINLTIPGSVTSIGSYAFSGCTSLVNITIPSSITSIGSYAFRGCNSLTNVYISDIAAWCNIDFDDDYDSNPLYYANKLYLNNELVKDIVIPEGVTSIPYYVFGCENIESITIPSSVKSIGRNAFSYNLKNVYINDLSAWCNIDFNGYGSYPLYYANKLYVNNELVQDIVIPEGVTSIPRYAFSCENIESITTPSSVTSIGSYAFSGCTSLIKATLQEGVETIDNHAFYNCNSLVNITIPSSVTSIGYNAFDGCNSLVNITIPSSVTSIGSSAFSDCTSLINLTIPGSVTSIGSYAFIGCNSLTNVYISDIAAWCNIDFDDDYDSNPLYYANKLYVNNELVKDIVIPEGVTSIPKFAFSCKNIESITIPGSVTSIGSYAFSDCTNLQNIFVDDNNPIYADVDGVLIDKSKETLILCPKATKLTSLSIPSSVKSIGSSAFSGCTSLIKATLQEGVETIDDYAFDNCNSLVNITIPSSVKSIGLNAFRGCTSLTNVYISDIAAWCNIDFDGFDFSSNPLYHANKLYVNNELVQDVVIPEGVTSIPKFAFSCENIESITIPSSVKSIGRNVFDYNLKNVYINDLSAWCNIDFYYYDSNPFIYAENLYLNNEFVIDLVIPDDVTAISNYAFFGCGSIRSVIIPGSVTSIGTYAFAECNNLTSVSLPKNISILEERAFSGSYNLKKIFIPKSLQLIKAYNFNVDYDGNSKLTDIYYEGTEQEWEQITILSNNEGLNNATIHYNSTGLPIAGDIDGTEGISDRDVVYLLNYTFDSENYPLNQDCDFNGDGVVNDRDAIYLLYNSFLPDKYPLN